MKDKWYRLRVSADANLNVFGDQTPFRGTYFVSAKLKDGKFFTCKGGLVPSDFRSEEVPEEFIIEKSVEAPQR